MIIEHISPVSQKNEWILEAHAARAFICRIEAGDDHNFQADFNFRLSSGSSLHFFPIITGAKDLSLSITIILEDNATAIIRGAYALENEQRYIITTRQEHRGKNSRSSLVINGTVNDEATVTYQGTIEVKKMAYDTNAGQENKTILCSDRARAVSIPALEIDTNQVQCAHGSAVGPLNKEHIYYAQTRGIREGQAKKLFLAGFFYQTFQNYLDADCVDSVVKTLVAKSETKEGQ
jgi:Fe-S cluster assembly protein SufD